VSRLEEPFAPGLQPERTLLAWRRTCLAFAVVTVVATRFTVDRLGPAAVALGILGSGLAGVTYAVVSIRYRRIHESLAASGVTGQGALPLALAFAAALVLGLACAAYLVVDLID
jgi:uncharacterized membrane protein YidH (DUF202 family)